MDLKIFRMIVDHQIIVVIQIPPYAGMVVDHRIIHLIPYIYCKPETRQND